MKPKENHARTNARLAAVQALYQMETSGSGVEKVIEEFLAHRLGGEIEGAVLHDADGDYFATIVRGTVEAQTRIDPYIERQLAKNWTLARIDSTARAILRAAIHELIWTPETPAKVVIDEYVELARAFFDDGDEPGFINGVLDAAARDVRTSELAG